MELQEQFEKAVADSRTIATKPSNEVLLKLYGLYKQSTQGDAGEAPLNAFDFSAKFKHEAWAKLAGIPKERAMQDYIQLVKELVGGSV